MSRRWLIGSVIAVVAALLTVAPVAGADSTGTLFDMHSIAIAPDGLHVYAGQGLGSPYVGLRRDPATGRLAFTARPTFPGTGASAGGDFRHSIAVSPDSTSVYDSRNGTNALRQMSVVGDGLTFARDYVNYLDGISGMAGPQTVAFSPDGACLYVTTSSGVVAFVHNANNTLTFVASSTASGTPVIALGDHLYLGGQGFTRNPTTCSVTPGAFTAAGTIGDGGLAASPDGKQLYRSSRFMNKVEVLQRNPVTGQITLDQTLTEGIDGVAGLDGASDIVVSPDGKNVYTSASVENAIAVFDRNTTTGRLTQSSVVRNGVNGVSGLAGAQSLVITPDGANVYTVASGVTSAVAGFAREAATGRLTFIQTITDADGPARWTQPLAPPRPQSPPSLRVSGFSISRRAFRPGTKGISLRFTLSEAATATITIVRKDPGKRTGAKCVVPTKKLKRARSCTRLVNVRVLSARAKAGANAVPLATNKLRSSDYLAQIRARVAADGRTTPLVTIRFTVTKQQTSHR